MKRVISILVVFLFALTVLVPPVLAIEKIIASPKPISATLKPIPYCGNKTAQAPITLKGEGIVCGWGKGKVAYKVEKGRVLLKGYGIAAVKGTDDIQVNGFGGHLEFGGWQFYWGRGSLIAKGENFRVKAWITGFTRGNGKGKVTFRGQWRIRYGKLIQLQAEPIEAIEIPKKALEEVKLEAEILE